MAGGKDWAVLFEGVVGVNGCDEIRRERVGQSIVETKRGRNKLMLTDDESGARSGWKRGESFRWRGSGVSRFRPRGKGCVVEIR